MLPRSNKHIIVGSILMTIVFMIILKFCDPFRGHDYKKTVQKKERSNDVGIGITSKGGMGIEFAPGVVVDPETGGM